MDRELERCIWLIVLVFASLLSFFLGAVSTDYEVRSQAIAANAGGYDRQGQWEWYSEEE